MMKYKHTIVRARLDVITEILWFLDAMSADGWEYIHCLEYSKFRDYYFRRPQEG